MSEKRLTTYDPDPERAEAEAWHAVNAETNISELAKPVPVKLLVQMHRMVRQELLERKHENSEVRAANQQLLADREGLKVENASLRARVSNTWVEIPVSILAGFGINLITSGHDGVVGWFILLVGIVILLAIRGEQILTPIRRQPRLSEDNHEETGQNNQDH